MRGDDRRSREDQQRLQIALSKAIDIPEELGLNESVEDFTTLQTYFKVFNIDSDFSNFLLDSTKQRGKGKFFKSMDPLNRIISAEEQLQDKKKAARNEDKNEGDYSPATQGSSKRSVAGEPAPEDSSPSESEEFKKMRSALKEKNHKIKKLKEKFKELKTDKEDLELRLEDIKEAIR